MWSFTWITQDYVVASGFRHTPSYLERLVGIVNIYDENGFICKHVTTSQCIGPGREYWWCKCCGEPISRPRMGGIYSCKAPQGFAPNPTLFFTTTSIRMSMPSTRLEPRRGKYRLLTFINPTRHCWQQETNLKLALTATLPMNVVKVNCVQSLYGVELWQNFGHL